MRPPNMFGLVIPFYILLLTIWYNAKVLKYMAKTNSIVLIICYNTIGLLSIFMAPFHIENFGNLFFYYKMYRTSLVPFYMVHLAFPKNIDYIYNIAITYLRIGNTKMVIKYADKVLYNNNSVLSRIIRSYAARNVGEWELEAENLERAKQSDYKDPDISLRLASIYYENNSLRKARINIDEYFSIHEEDGVDGTRNSFEREYAMMIKMKITEIETVTEAITVNMR